MEKIFFSGRLGADAEVVVVNGEERFISLSATPSRFKERESDSKYLKWYKISLNISLRSLLPLLKKGAVVTVVGNLRIGVSMNPKDHKVYPSATIFAQDIAVYNTATDPASGTSQVEIATPEVDETVSSPEDDGPSLLGSSAIEEMLQGKYFPEHYL